MDYLIYGSYRAHIFSGCHPNLVGVTWIYREVILIYRIFPYLSFIVNVIKRGWLPNWLVNDIEWRATFDLDKYIYIINFIKW